MSLPAPLAEELTPAPDPEVAFRRLARQRHCLFLDSAQQHENLGRYSFLTADPIRFRCLPTSGASAAAGGAAAADPFQQLVGLLEDCQSATLAGLPPFQGGIAGLFAYGLAHHLESIPRPRCDEFAVPALAVGLYDVVLAYDHQRESAWLISQGYPARGASQRRQRAAARLQQFREWLAASEPAFADDTAAALPVRRLAPQYPMIVSPDVTSDFSAAQYRSAVERAVEYIHAGDIFQVNLSQRLLTPARDHAVELFCRMRRRNPAPFAGYFDLGGYQIVSASPERFLRVCQREVEARPIKGTRQRTAQPEADLFAASELVQSEKDRAENVMIVDLMRNDLSRVCQPDSVRVTQLCQLEVYAFVQHLVSAVCGRLVESASLVDLLRATFPAGSITGAPKVRAMEIISELEPTGRGAYCGSLGYLGGDGTMDASVLIRTITAGQGWWQLPVGGGIVAQSNPIHEYEETWHKAAGMLRSLV